jgi:hypothetical protein
MSAVKSALTPANIGGAVLLVLGVSVWLYFVITDRCDPDYSPPANIVAVNLAFWGAIAGGSMLVAPRIWRWFLDPTFLLALFVFGAIPFAWFSAYITEHDAFYFGPPRIDQILVFATLTVLGAWISLRQIIQGGWIRKALFAIALLAHLWLIASRVRQCYNFWVS